MVQDGGDPAVEASPRDIVYTMPASAAGNGTGPQTLAQTDLRCGVLQEVLHMQLHAVHGHPS